MTNLKPITYADLEVGKAYLTLEVDMAGHMRLTHYKVLGEPYRMDLALSDIGVGEDIEAWWISVEATPLEFDDPLSEEMSVADMGCPMPTEEVMCDNFHRTFNDTPENRQELGKLVATQNLRAYLSMIGQNAEQAIKSLKKHKDPRARIKKVEEEYLLRSL